MGEDQDVKDKIISLDDELDQVLILEKMDESLVLMAQSLCWSLRQVHNFDLYFYGWVIIAYLWQVRYVQHNSRMSDFVTTLTEESRDILTDWLWADFHLYKYFVERHRKRFSAERVTAIKH